MVGARGAQLAVDGVDPWYVATPVRAGHTLDNTQYCC